MPKERRKPKPESIADAAKEMAEQPLRLDLPPCPYYLSTGSTILDLAISDRYPGGVGGGRITHFYGDASTAKTVVAQEILGDAQRKKGYAIFEDAEYTLDFGRAILFGLYTSKWVDEDVREEHQDKPLAKAIMVGKQFVYRTPETIEALFDDEIGGALKLMEAGKLPPVTALGVDTLTALKCKSEDGRPLEKADYGDRAKMFSRAFRRYIRPMARIGLTVVIIDQTREAIGSMFRSHTTSGGRAKTFYSSTRVLLRMAGEIKNTYDQTIGIKVGFDIEKNKVGPPHRTGQFRLLFELGVDDVTSNLEWLKEHRVLSGEEEQERDCLAAEYEQLIAEAPSSRPAPGERTKRELKTDLKKALEKYDKKSGWWEFGGVKKQSLDALVAHVEDADQEEAVRQEVARVWRIIHQPTKRKPRHG